VQHAAAEPPQDPTSVQGAQDPATAQCKFTVVVPAFNAARTLLPCMRSVLYQTVSDFELVVVNDGSTDDTGQIAESVDDARVRVVHQENRGLSAARNAGITVATNDVVCFLDADDLLLPQYLQATEQTFARSPGIDFVYTDAWQFDDRTRRVIRRTRASRVQPPRPQPATARELFLELLQRNFMVIPVAVRVDAFRSAGLFDETLASAEDWEMWLRLAAHGHRAGEAAGPLALLRMHSEQMSKDAVKMSNNFVRTFEKVLREFPLDDAERTLVSDALTRARSEREIVTGSAGVRSALRSGRHRLGWLRQRIGVGDRWYRTPPAPVASVFADLGQN
jgi:hypothetical protein